ncbi:acyl carrier protein [Nocardia thraciensis]
MITTHDITELMTGLDIDTATLQPDLPLEDQGIDSMDMTTLLARTETTYNITIPTHIADSLHTLDQLTHYVNSAKAP